MQVVILAAGYGTRLYPLTKHRPKALLPVGHKPLVDWLLDNCVGLPGLRRIWMVTNHRYIGQFRRWHAQHPQRGRIRLIDDGSTSNRNRRGAIKDLQLALRRGTIRGHLLVVAGDNYIGGRIAAFVRAARRRCAPAIGLYQVASRRLASRYGTVRLHRAGRIVGFVEKSPQPASRLVSMGLYYLPTRARRLVEHFLRQQPSADAPGHFFAWLAARRPVYGIRLRGAWFDIGDRQSYRRAVAYATRST